MKNNNENLPVIGCTKRISGNIIMSVGAGPLDTLWTVGVGVSGSPTASLYQAVHNITDWTPQEAQSIANWHADTFMDDFEETVKSNNLLCVRCEKEKDKNVSYLCEECFQETMELLSPRKPVKDNDLITDKNFSLEHVVNKERNIRAAVRISTIHDGEWMMVLCDETVSHSYYEPIVAPTRTEAQHVMNRLISKYHAMDDTEKEKNFNYPKD